MSPWACRVYKFKALQQIPDCQDEPVEALFIFSTNAEHPLPSTSSRQAQLGVTSKLLQQS